MVILMFRFLIILLCIGIVAYFLFKKCRKIDLTENLKMAKEEAVIKLEAILYEAKTSPTIDKDKLKAARKIINNLLKESQNG